jgi:predicted DNA-binding transcriptional regulator AlpA
MSDPLDPSTPGRPAEALPEASRQCISVPEIAQRLHLGRRAVYALLEQAVRHGGEALRSVPRSVDLAQVPAVPWAWVDEHVYAAIRGCSVKVLQRERRLNRGCPFRRINGTTIRYRLGEITAFLESQPRGGGGEKPGTPPRRGPGRPGRSAT